MIYVSAGIYLQLFVGSKNHKGEQYQSRYSYIEHFRWSLNMLSLWYICLKLFFSRLLIFEQIL